MIKEDLWVLLGITAAVSSIFAAHVLFSPEKEYDQDNKLVCIRSRCWGKRHGETTYYDEDGNKLCGFIYLKGNLVLDCVIEYEPRPYFYPVKEGIGWSSDLLWVRVCDQNGRLSDIVLCVKDEEVASKRFCKLSNNSFKAFLKDRISPFKEELVRRAWHPNRFLKWCVEYDFYQ